jgi:hypothetical protein
MKRGHPHGLSGICHGEGQWDVSITATASELHFGPSNVEVQELHRRLDSRPHTLRLDNGPIPRCAAAVTIA